MLAASVFSLIRSTLVEPGMGMFYSEQFRTREEEERLT